jgi:hypothetical protein
LAPELADIETRQISVALQTQHRLGLAVEGALASFGEMPHLREALDAGRPGRAQLVARLDRQGTYYYLVPVNAAGDREDRTLAVIMVDALYGDVLSVSASESPYPLWRVDRDEVRERVTRRPIPVYESLGAAADRLVEAISQRRCGHAYGSGATSREPEQALAAPQLSLRETAMAAIGSYASPTDYVLLRPGEFEIGEILAWDPCGGRSPFQPYHVVRTAWKRIYVNAYDGAVLAQFDLCPWAQRGLGRGYSWARTIAASSFSGSRRVLWVLALNTQIHNPRLPLRTYRPVPLWSSASSPTADTGVPALRGSMPGSPSHGPTSSVTVPLWPDTGSHSHFGVSKTWLRPPGAGGSPRAAATWSVVSIAHGSRSAAGLALLAGALAVAATVPIAAAPFGAPDDVPGPPEQPATSMPAATVSRVRRKVLLTSAGRPWRIRVWRFRIAAA